MVINVMNFLSKVFVLILLFSSSLAYACGDNPNAMVQGPFKDFAINEGYICFQGTTDKRNIEFYQSYKVGNTRYNNLIDTFYYSDAPVELMTVFFKNIHAKRNVVILLRWNVNYETGGTKYNYYYEIKTYQLQGEGTYSEYLDAEKDPYLSGYQTSKNGLITKFKLDNSSKIKKYFNEHYDK